MTHALPLLLVLLTLILGDVGEQMYQYLTVSDYRISLWAHLFGGLSGILVGIGILLNLKVRNWEKMVWWIAVSFYVVLMITGIFIHIFYEEYFKKIK